MTLGALVPETARIIDLQSYRERKAAARQVALAGEAMPFSPLMLWQPVWFMVPVFFPVAMGPTLLAE